VGGMRELPDLADVRVEPDIILLGPEEPVLALGPDDGPSTRRGGPAAGLRRLRRFVEPGLLVVGAGVMLLAVQLADGRGSPVAGPAASVSPSVGPSAVGRDSHAHPRLVVPQAATPGEWIPVLAYRNHRLCGATELHFDGAPVAHRQARYVGPANPGRMEMFLTMEVPLSATPGSHKVELYGPMPGGRSGPVCADVPEHQGKLATTTIAVGSRRK
jgi:hypothetical protein